MLITEINKLTALGLGGVDVTRYLPLEICSFALYTIICDSIKPDNKFCPQMLVTLFLPAAIMALIFPTTIYLPLFNYFTIHQFFFHGLIIAYIISRFSNGEIEINYPGVWKSVLKICVIAFFVFLIDTFLNRNFMFLKNSDNNFLLNIIQDVTGGGIFYTLGLVGFVMVVIHIFFFIFKPLEILFRKKKTVDTV